MSCRVGSSVVSQGVVTAIGLGADGRKHFLGCDVVDTESEDSWAAFLGGLRERGLAGVRLVVSDSHAGSWPPSRACSRAAPGSAA